VTVKKIVMSTAAALFAVFVLAAPAQAEGNFWDNRIQPANFWDNGSTP
jgi:hypothetical protein